MQDDQGAGGKEGVGQYKHRTCGTRFRVTSSVTMVTSSVTMVTTCRMTKGREGRRVWVSTNTEPVERDLELLVVLLWLPRAG